MAARTNRVVNDVHVGADSLSAEVTSNEAPIETIVAEGVAIWDAVRIADPRGNEAADALLKQLRADHPDFAKTFPLILRWTVQIRRFSRAALEKYLRNFVQPHYKDRETFLEAQVEYPVLLFKEDNPRVPPRVVSEYRDGLIRSLKDDDKTFMEAAEEAKEIVAELEAAADADRRETLMQVLGLC